MRFCRSSLHLRDRVCAGCASPNQMPGFVIETTAVATPFLFISSIAFRGVHSETMTSALHLSSLCLLAADVILHSFRVRKATFYVETTGSSFSRLRLTG